MGLKNKSIIVTGGAGFIGSHLVDSIIRHSPEKITVLDNFFLGKKENLDEARKNFPKLDIISQDITDFKATKKIIESRSADIVFNMAVIPLPTSLERPEWTYEQNVKMTLNICEMQRKGLFKTLIQCSSSEVYGSAAHLPMKEDHPQRPMTPYAASKAATDSLAVSYHETFGMDISIPRPFNNYGPRQNDRGYAGVIPFTIRRIINNEIPVVHGDGKQTRDFIYVQDTADAIVDICLSEKTRGRIINIASGKETSIIGLISSIMRIMGCKKEIKHDGPRPGDVRRHMADISLARKLIGFKSAVEMEEGLARTVEYYRG